MLDSSDVEEGGDREPGEVIQGRGETDDSQSENTGGTESQDSGTEKQYARSAKRQKLSAKKRSGECDGDTGDDTLTITISWQKLRKIF